MLIWLGFLGSLGCEAPGGSVTDFKIGMGKKSGLEVEGLAGAV